MICELCHGTGHKQVTRSPWVNAIYAIPCPRCGGAGVDHCCGGERASEYDRQEQAHGQGQPQEGATEKARAGH